MLAEDINDLYKLLRGNKAAAKVLEARTLAFDGKHELVIEKLNDALDSYKASRSRFLKPGAADQITGKGADADRQRRTAERKYEKTIEVIKAFEELMPTIEKLAERDRKRAERESAKQGSASPQTQSPSEEEPAASKIADDDSDDDSSPENSGAENSGAEDSCAEDSGDGDTGVKDHADSNPESSAEAAPASTANLDQAFVDAYSKAEGDEVFDVVLSRFDFREIASEGDVHSSALYLINNSDQLYLVETKKIDSATQTVAMTDIIKDKPVKPFKLAQFVKLGKDRKMVMLTQRDQATQSEFDTVANPSMVESDTEDGTPELLDIGAFSQLLTAAQRSGMVPGADQIAHTRDREFRKKQYDMAFQAINNVFAQFTSNANQRAQRLTREDADIASGRVQMSPKDVVAKRARDRAQSAEVERARRRFQIVLEGLRQLIANQAGS
ncbi:hypothetical protein Pla22_46690 [Rubripirellula amarantea]|uniref:Uncharacterized protein n=1 Tax=Rubripirellula amarantea TaxID=2527999 RepID=A0A5C5WI39_9BACT|nr:hypothetical protein [Rubripirellula amarantea]TWT49472.1 hypothetical protein Pla22_46690 [Rubripirellula amarantea]